MARLSVNVEKAALLRNLGGNREADPVKAAVIAELGGCDGIVCTIREGFSTITERDLKMLREMVTTHLNIQVPAVNHLVNAALSVHPDMVTLISGRDADGLENAGLDILGHQDQTARIVEGIRAQDIVVSSLVDPEILQIKAAAKAGFDYVELHTGTYASAGNSHEKNDCFENLSMVSLAAAKLGLGVSAGQGLTFQNIRELTGLEKIEEFNAGGCVIGRALWIGMEAAVRDMVSLVR